MINKKFVSMICLSAAMAVPDFSFAQEPVTYQMPAKSIADLVDAPLIPKVELNADQSWMLTLIAPRYVDMDLAAYPLLGLGGLRANPITRTLEAENHGFYTNIEIKNLKNNQERITIQGLPQNMKMSTIKWSPSGQSFVFTNRTPKGLELWLIDLQTKTAKAIFTQPLNALIGDLVQWHPSGDYVLVLVPSRHENQLPVRDRIPVGPVVQENLGVKNSSRTYQNLLGDRNDENLFDHYLESQLTKVFLDGRHEKVGKPAIFKGNEYSPDGQYLLVQTIKRPYSYQLPLDFFPVDIEIWSHGGEVVKTLANIPLVQNSGGGFDNASPNGRSYGWRQDKPSEISWIKSARVEGTANGKEEFQDGLYTLAAPFSGDQKLLFKTATRLNSVVWGNGSYAVVKESLRRTRSLKWTLINPETGAAIKVIDDRSSEDTYSDPGNFVMKGGTILFTGKNSPTVFTIGTGASPQGERPFLLRWDLLKGTKDTLFKSNPALYEMPVTYDGVKNLYVSRESSELPANLYHIQLGKKQVEVALTHIKNPYVGLEGVQKKLITYTRKDGLKLTGTLYLPKGFQANGAERLPVLVWAYPREFKSAELASQVKGSPNRFAELNFRSPVYWVTRGYAIVENADMPIVGEGEQEPNDTFIEQIEWNSAALIDYLVDEGIADRNRFGVGGHSYGAFMTANLLAHTNLFAAGIARSGAYNRTLTPFGFQSETRTYWQSKDIYDRMSPFTYADKIKLPLLITHGMDDENSGTFPVQSERLYAAIKGHGGTTRLVMFPYEFHGFRARESIMHVFWEQDQWLETYVKNRKVN